VCSKILPAAQISQDIADIPNGFGRLKILGNIKGSHIPVKRDCPQYRLHPGRDNKGFLGWAFRGLQECHPLRSPPSGGVRSTPIQRTSALGTDRRSEASIHLREAV